MPWWRSLLLGSVVRTIILILRASSRVMVLENTRSVVGAYCWSVLINFKIRALLIERALEELLSFLLLILTLEVLSLIASRVEAIDIVVSLMEEVDDTRAIVAAWRSVASTSWSRSWHVSLNNLVHVRHWENSGLRSRNELLDVSLLFTTWHVSMSWCLMMAAIVLS